MTRAHQDSTAREPLSRAKLSHKLPAQVCALWVPSMHGYLVEFSSNSFRAIENAELARHYNENEASSAALAFREITGLLVVIRPVYLHLDSH